MVYTKNMRYVTKNNSFSMPIEPLTREHDEAQVLSADNIIHIHSIQGPCQRCGEYTSERER